MLLLKIKTTVNVIPYSLTFHALYVPELFLKFLHSIGLMMVVMAENGSQ